jgi:hypothetical protein
LSATPQTSARSASVVRTCVAAFTSSDLLYRLMMARCCSLTRLVDETIEHRPVASSSGFAEWQPESSRGGAEAYAIPMGSGSQFSAPPSRRGGHGRTIAAGVLFGSAQTAGVESRRERPTSRAVLLERKRVGDRPLGVRALFPARPARPSMAPRCGSQCAPSTRPGRVRSAATRPASHLSPQCR